MNYSPPLDAFFSSPYLSFGTIFGLVILGFIFRKPLFINRKNKTALGFLYFGVFLAGIFTILIFNPMYFGYGKPIGMKQALVNGNSVFILDYRLMAGGEGDDPTPFYRVHVVDVKSGEKKRRFLVGDNAEILFVNGNEIVVRKVNEPYFYNAETGKLNCSWTAETLPALYPELKTGVDQLQLSGSTFTVTSKDGRQWMLNMMDHTITSAENLAAAWKSISIDPQEFFAKDDGFYKMKPDGMDQEFISLSGNDGNDKRKQLRNASDSLLNKDLYFVEGIPLAASEKAGALVILHYTTTDKMNFILTAFSLDGKKQLWEFEQKNIHPNTTDSPTETCWAYDKNSGLLIFCMEDEVMAVNIGDGKIM